MKEITRVFLSFETSRAYGRELLRGIAKYSRIHGPWMFIKDPEFYRANPIGTRNLFPANIQVDGIIMREDSDMRKIIASGIPTIVASYKYPDLALPKIMADCDKIGKMAAEYFLNRGFRHFAYCGLNDMFWSQKRGRSFTKTVKKAGYNVISYESGKTKKSLTPSQELKNIVNWLVKLPKQAAILACNDDRANEIVDACKIANVRIPEEVAILGVDNDDMICDTSAVPISSIALNLQNAGYEAARRLDKYMHGGKISKKTIYAVPTHVVTRHSTDIMAIDDPDVVRAISFIRKNCNKRIQVTDVAEEVALSKRMLYDKFQKNVARSVYDEIIRIRIDKISQLLKDTQLSIYEIATAMGYSSDKHLARYFKRQMGMSPLAYRKKLNNHDL